MITAAIVAIAIPPDIEIAREVLARGRRIADRLALAWLAFLIQTRSLRLTRISSADMNTIRCIVELVTSFGGQMLCAEADDVARALVELSCREHAEVLVLGSSRRPGILRRLVPGTTERVLRSRHPFDVIVTREGVDS